MAGQLTRYVFCEYHSKRKIFLTVILLILLGAGFWYSGKLDQQIKQAQREMALAAKVDEYAEELNQLKAATVAESKPVEQKEIVIKQSSVNGVIAQDGIPHVIIDGQIFAEGDVYGDYIIQEVTFQYTKVYHQVKKEEKTLRFAEEPATQKDLEKAGIIIK